MNLMISAPPMQPLDRPFSMSMACFKKHRERDQIQTPSGDAVGFPSGTECLNKQKNYSTKFCKAGIEASLQNRVFQQIVLITENRLEHGQPKGGRSRLLANVNL